MSEIGDGGPAFPREEYQSPPSGRGQEGMSLRDYFAGQALAGFASIEADVNLIKGAGGPEAFVKLISEAAYKHADAMLEARTVKS